MHSSADSHANSPAAPPLPLHLAIKEEAVRLGFDLCRILPITTAPHIDFFEAWIGADRAGEMGYLARNLAKRRDPRRLVATDQPTPATMIVLGVNHHQFDLPPTVRADPSRGLIASYAWGDDYHELIRPQLFALDHFICTRSGRTTQGKCLVDTGPVLERDWAQQAGIGFVGKNCCLIHPTLGSWLLLATILIPETPTPDPPLLALQPAPSADAVLHGLQPDGHWGAWQASAADPAESAAPDARQMTCGRCTRCLVACPTAAFVGPYHLDPQRCISYWTIEAKGAIPRSLRGRFGNRIFGCDICQEVCPWNQRLPERRPLLTGLEAQVARVAPSLLEGFAPATPYWLQQAAFSARFRRSPIKRAKRAGMLRNVCVALGNWGAPAAIEALQLALADESPIVRGHAAWGLGEVGAQGAAERVCPLLRAALASEADDHARAEIAHALASVQNIVV